MTSGFRKRRSPGMLALAAVVRVLRWVGVRTDLLVLEREGRIAGEIRRGDDHFEYRFLSPAEVDALIRLEPDVPRESLDAMFAAGKRCFGAWDEDRLVAKMWCDLDELYHPAGPRQLDADEAYLLLAYVDPERRGRNLAPRMRIECYAALRALGRTRLYSYSRYFNTAARRFKAKLGTRPVSLLVHIRLFGRWSKSVSFPMGSAASTEVRGSVRGFFG